MDADTHLRLFESTRQSLDSITRTIAICYDAGYAVDELVAAARKVAASLAEMHSPDAESTDG